MSAIEQIDRRLSTWTEWLARVDDNLLALEGEPTYQMLAGLSGKRAHLSGISAERVLPALDALADLFQQRQRLGDVFERAKEIRASMSQVAFWENDDKMKAIVDLLDGPSITLDARTRPLARRGLLDRSADDVAVSPEQLLGSMVRAFEVARDAVLAVRDAWAILEPALERMEKEVVDLRAMAKNVDELEAVSGALSAIEHALLGARSRLACDPLGASNSIEGELAPCIADVRSRLTALSSMRPCVLTALAGLTDKRRTLGESHQRARSTLALAMKEYADAGFGEPTSDESLRGLDEWREKLERTATARRWSSAAVGVERWSETCERYLAADRAVIAATEALASKHAELGGRLSARIAQLETLAARGVRGDPVLEDLLRDAQATLERRPLSLDSAETALAAFERALAELVRSRR